MHDLLRQRLMRGQELERLLTDPNVLSDRSLVAAYAKELAALKPLLSRYREFQRSEEEIRKTQALLESKETVGEMRALALSELQELKSRLQSLEEELEGFLLTDEPGAHKSVIMEIRAGTGGAEASLFAADLYRMYTRYAARFSWRVEPLSMGGTEAGGLKEAIFAVEGDQVFKHLRFERGVHRVQRVPATEAAGRIHTSTVTVAVLPQAQALEVQVDPKELRVDVFRSSGPGGQGVNTTDSAVRLTHLPSGIVVTCQDERSQIKNKAKAMKVLLARLLDHKMSQQQSERDTQRRAQIGTGERSEKIRTYNFPDRRVTDHRINFTSHRLEEILNGDLDELIAPLAEAERQAKLGEKGRLSNA